MNSLKKYLTPSTLLFAILLGISVVVAVIVNIEVKSSFNMPKLFALRLFTIAAIIISAYQMWRSGSFSYIKTRFNRYLAIYSIVIFFVTIFSVQIDASIIGTEGRFLGIITMFNFFLLAFLTMNTLTTRKRLIIFISVSTATAFLLAIYGLMQNASDIATYPRLAPIVQKIVGDPAHWTQDPTDRVFGTMGHANHFGAYLAFHIMLLGGLILTVKKWWAKILMAMAGLIMFSAVMTTESRGAIVALVAGIFIFAIFSAKIEWNGIKRWKWPILGLFVAMILVVGIFQGQIVEKVKNSGLGQRTIGTIQFLQAGNIPDRVSWWFSSFEMFADHPILGQGLSTYKDVYNLYRRLDYKVPGDEQDTTTPESTHMAYFNILAEQGIVGLTAYIFFIGFVVFTLGKFVWLSTTNISTYHSIIIGILAALTTYLVQVLMSFGE
ncbi:O-antigen ligase family protein, partial [Candidatus Peregrinibacteria bacterium]|nr:O-antigen ligase family protein [Candidatus Peregrinibacteria bacterium]